MSHRISAPGNPVEQAIGRRRSIRAFLPDPVPRPLIERILRVAARAPSGSNTQPWKVIVLTDKPLRRLCSELHAMALAGSPGDEEYRYYPDAWHAPYLARRRKVGWDLYGSLGIKRGDTEGIAHQAARNYLFFDAPVGMIFTIDRNLQIGSWLDYGMFLQSIMIAARSHGLDTCPQQAFAKYHLTIRCQLEIPADEVVICGLALGYADPSAPENRFATERMDLHEFAIFME